MKINLATLSFRKVLWSLIALFIVLFLARLGYGYSKSQVIESDYSGASYFENQSDLRKNYASEKSKGEPSAAPPPPGSAQAAQKYEKTATLNSRTDDFESDEKGIRQTSDAFRAIIQYEQKNGNPGNRTLHLMIGVRPEAFDSFYVAAQRIGHIYVNSITKVDKTTEFRELNAQKASLEKALANLTDLKNRAGSISDLVGLHDKILEIENRMQELGVQLGNFAAENEFCTVRFSLYENAAARTISLAHRIYVAFTWTVQYYLLLLVALVLALATSWLLLVVLAKTKALLKQD